MTISSYLFFLPVKQLGNIKEEFFLILNVKTVRLTYKAILLR